MKRLFSVLILFAVLLSACGTKATPTISDSDLATKVAQILTNQPTPTNVPPKVVTATPSLPTIAPTTAANVPATSVATQAPATAAPTRAPATATPGATAAPAATATPAQPTTTLAPSATLLPGDPKVKLGAPTYKDSMANGDNWPTGEDAAGFSSIDFKSGTMLFTALKSKDGWRLTFDKLTDFYMEMTVKTGACKGMDRYGLIFRVPSNVNANQGYLAGLSCDGKFSLRKWDGPNNAMTGMLAWKANSAIQAGANQTNRLGVMVKGGKFSLYANGVPLGEASDLGYSSGYFGVFAGAIETTNFTITVDEIDYWVQ